MNIPDLIEHSDTDLASKSDRLGAFVGNTPLFPITNLTTKKGVRVFAKLEWQQFGGSVKARPAYRIVKDAIRNGELTRDKQLLDASSGNTGIAYAHIGAVLGIPVTLCLPENASEERKQILNALGVNIVYTSRTGGTDEAQDVATEMAEKDPETYYYADQYNNPSNWKSHYDTTAPEILEQTGGKVTHFVAGMGTTGTFTGTGRRLKEHNTDIQLIALQPDIAMHGLEGWKHLETACVPGIYDDALADEVRPAGTERSYKVIKLAAEKEGLLISPSAAANLAAALNLAEELEEGAIVTILPDDASKYGEVIHGLFE